MRLVQGHQWGVAPAAWLIGHADDTLAGIKQACSATSVAPMYGCLLEWPENATVMARGSGVGGRQGFGGASIHHSGKSDAVVRTFISIDFFEAVAVDARAWVSRGL